MRLLCFAVAVLLATQPAFGGEPASGNSAAISLYREKRNDEARAAFEKLSADDPTNAEAAHFLGLIALREKRYDDAVSLHEKATALAPGNSAYFVALGDAYGRKASSASLFAKLGWAEKCRAVLERAVALEPQSFAANAALIEYYRRAPGMAGGGMAKAYAQAESFKKIVPAAGTRLLADLYLIEKKFAETFAAVDETLKTYPDNYPLLLSYGRAAAESGRQLERGVDYLQRALNLRPPPETQGHAWGWFYLGQIRARQNDTAAARAAYESALKLDPGHRPSADALQKLSDADATGATR